MPVLRIGEPRRHLASQHRGLDRLGIRPHILIRQKRHRRDLARSMASLAIPLEDRQHVLIEGDIRRPSHLAAQSRRQHESPHGLLAEEILTYRHSEFSRE